MKTHLHKSRSDSVGTRQIGMEVVGKVVAELTCQDLCHFLVDDDVDFDPSLSGSLKHSVKTVLLVCRRWTPEVPEDPVSCCRLQQGIHTKLRV